MSATLLVKLYYLSTILVIFLFLAELLKKKNLSFLVLLSSFLISTFAMVSITVVSGHLPVSGDFEKFQLIVFYLLFIMLIQKIFFNKIVEYNWITPLLAFVFLILIMFQKKSVSDNLLIYSRIDVVLFFQLRMLSIAFFVYVISLQFIGLAKLFEGKDHKDILHISRNFTILGAATFLGGEFFGSLWALDGWGDPWRWSKGFLTATAMFLLSMVIPHLPISFFKNLKTKILVSTIPFIIIILLYII